MTLKNSNVTPFTYATQQLLIYFIRIKKAVAFKTLIVQLVLTAINIPARLFTEWKVCYLRCFRIRSL